MEDSYIFQDLDNIIQTFLFQSLILQVLLLENKKELDSEEMVRKKIGQVLDNLINNLYWILMLDFHLELDSALILEEKMKIFLALETTTHKLKLFVKINQNTQS